MALVRSLTLTPGPCVSRGNVVFYYTVELKGKFLRLDGIGNARGARLLFITNSRQMENAKVILRAAEWPREAK